MSYILTHTGQRFDYERVEDMLYNIEDIAHSLSNQCRFLGHTSRFYSISEHSRFVAALLKKWNHSPYTQLHGLLHDLSEAYLGDMPTPLKQYCPPYKDLENRILSFALPQLGLPFPTRLSDKRVKMADGVALAVEVEMLMPQGDAGVEWIGAYKKEGSAEVWSNLPRGGGEADMFLSHYYSLMQRCEW